MSYEIVFVALILGPCFVVATFLLFYTQINRSKVLKKHYNDLIELKQDQLLRLRSKFARTNELPTEMRSGLKDMGADVLLSTFVNGLPHKYQAIAKEWGPSLLKILQDKPEILEAIKGKIVSTPQNKKLDPNLTAAQQQASGESV